MERSRKAGIQIPILLILICAVPQFLHCSQTGFVLQDFVGKKTTWKPLHHSFSSFLFLEVSVSFQRCYAFQAGLHNSTDPKLKCPSKMEYGSSVSYKRVLKPVQIQGTGTRCHLLTEFGQFTFYKSMWARCIAVDIFGKYGQPHMVCCITQF